MPKKKNPTAKMYRDENNKLMKEIQMAHQVIQYLNNENQKLKKEMADDPNYIMVDKKANGSFTIEEPDKEAAE